jgi:hypothetical protein
MSKAPIAGLTTWFYAATSDSSFPLIRYRTGRNILEFGAASSRRLIPRSWRDANGGLTLVGIGLVLQMGHAAYVDRCSLSFHAFDATPIDAKPVAVDFEGLALRLLVDAKAPLLNIRLLAAFLEASRDSLLLEDMFALMQANRSDLEPVWMDYLASGRQSRPLFDIRTGQLHAPNTPLVLPDIAGRKGRRHHREI